MTVVVGALIVAAVTALAVTAMLLVRRRAPEGSRFTDGDRAAGVFGVLATGFSVLLGFIVFLAFTTYDESRAGAETEASVVVQLVETAQFFPAEVGQRLTGELICYGRSVVGEEWPALQAGTLGDRISPWGVALIRTMRTVEPRTPAQQSAYDRWHDQSSEREVARLDRIHGASGVLPSPLWVVLFFISAVIFGFVLFFADSGESAAAQAMLMGSVAAVITVLLLLLAFFDSPFRSGPGSLQPTAMERSLRLIDEGLAAIGASVAPPCDERGAATG